MNTLFSLLPVLQSAIGVIGAFQGSAAQAKVDSVVQDALDVVKAVTPLFDQFGSGLEVTPAQVRAALAGKDDALAAFDAEIAKHVV